MVNRTPTRASLAPTAQRLALVVGLVSAGAIAFEIALTRIFSLLFQYHYAFLAVSLAVLGLSFGTAIVKLRRIEPAAAAAALRRTLIALSLSYLVAAFLLAFIPTTATVLVHVAVSLVPMALTGAAMALLFMLRSQASGLLYGADLIAAAIGIAAALGLMALLGAFNLVIALGAVIALAAMVFGWPSAQRAYAVAQAAHGMPLPRSFIAATACLAISLALLILNFGTDWIVYSPLRTQDGPPDKTLLRVLRDPSFGAKLVYSAWDPFARVDVVETVDPRLKYVFTDGGAGSFMHRFDGDLGKVADLRGTVEYLPFAVGRPDRVLVLGAGAGKDVLLARLAGASDVVAVEVNPAMVEATRRFSDYNGHILDQPGVSVHVGDARTFADGAGESFDLVYLNVVYSQAAPPASQALAESYVFTREAFRAYLNRLNDGGRLAVVAHNGIEGTRAAITAIAALSDVGVPLTQTLNHIAVLMHNNPDPTQRATLLIASGQPLTDPELATLTAASRALNLQPLHLPGAFEAGFQGIKDGQTIDQFLKIDQTYELFPTTDDRPFFYKLDPGIPAPVAQAALISAALAISLLVLLLGQTRRASPAVAAYLAAIGLGFMLIEVPLIQRFQLLVGYPVLSLVLVLGTLLLAGGAGSWVSQRWPVESLMKRVMIAGAIIVGIGLIYLIALPAAVQAAVSLPPAGRALVVVWLTAPLGFAMGIPFPSLLRRVGERVGGNIALLWGVNGAFSALGATLAVWLAMSAGFQWAMLAGIAAYLTLILAAQRVRV
jgi:hypothetical protein